jgi:hypothetical protein
MRIQDLKIVLPAPLLSCVAAAAQTSIKLPYKSRLILHFHRPGRKDSDEKEAAWIVDYL